MRNAMVLVVAALAASTTLAGQSDWGAKPAWPVTDEVRPKKPEVFELKNGLKIVVIENRRFPEVTFNLTIDSTVGQHPEITGCASLIGGLLGNGSTTRTKDQLDKELAGLDATLNFHGGGASGASFTKHQARLLEIMADVLLSPGFEPAVFERIKSETLTRHSPGNNFSEANVWKVKSVLLYGKDNDSDSGKYRKVLENATFEQCRNYHLTYFKPNIAVLTVTGDVSASRLKPLVSEYFGAWERGDIPPKPLAEKEVRLPLPVEKNRVALIVRDDPVQSFVYIAYPIDLQPNTTDEIKAQVMNRILGADTRSRLSQALRDKLGLAYTAYSSLSAGETAGRFEINARIGKEVTDEAIAALMQEMRRLSAEEVSGVELQLAKDDLAEQFKEGMKYSYRFAAYSRSVEKSRELEAHHKTYLPRLQAVNSRDVKSMAAKYLKPDQAIILVVGDRKLADVLTKFSPDGAVEFYDSDGYEDSGLPYAPQFPQIGNELFKRISVDWSEEGGEFHMDNWVTNEKGYLGVLDDIDRHTVKGGVYIGVASNQNFAYIARIRPEIAFFVDIRRQNRMQHYVYKV